MGHTGDSAKENVNNIKIVHLHWGLQLIFDESHNIFNVFSDAELLQGA